MYDANEERRPIQFTGTPCFTVLCFTVLHGYCAFLKKLKLCGNFALSKSTDIIFFLKVFAHSVCLCHTLVILAICQTSSLLLY